jgi:dGTPase
MQDLRPVFEENEHRNLSPSAAFADQSRGRERPEEPDGLRTCYMRDRDRISTARRSAGSSTRPRSFSRRRATITAPA